MRRLAASVCLVLLAVAPAWALEDRSEYSRIEDCESRDPGDLAPYLDECAGHAGYSILSAYSEHSSRLSFGRRGLEAQLNEAPRVGGLYMEIGPVIDWRYSEGATAPYAALVRWKGITPIYDDQAGDYTGETAINANVLVVVALRDEGPVGACHIGYVDAMEVTGANEVAHRLARRYAPGFRCGVDPVMVIDVLSAEQLALTGD